MIEIAQKSMESDGTAYSHRGYGVYSFHLQGRGIRVCRDCRENISPHTAPHRAHDEIHMIRPHTLGRVS